ncbi:MAG: sulfurtransferase complex subunit TusB [Proteobacteria bacterium]|jgi:sulfur relay protein TusB/DsrH|nr:sulfurtransferase complex subunit TusB [Pseudomonadota bacterium]
MLHTFNKARLVDQNMRFVAAEDTVVLIEDGVYALLSDPELAQRPRTVAVEADLAARGLTHRTECETIDYRGLVKLCMDTDRIRNWF